MGATHYDPNEAYRGYTLFSANGGEDAYLIDMDGRFVHRWRSGRCISYGYLPANGNNLLRLYEYNPPELTRRVQGGVATPTAPERMREIWQQISTREAN